jgi:hypothetical protein
MTSGGFVLLGVFLIAIGALVLMRRDHRAWEPPSWQLGLGRQIWIACGATQIVAGVMSVAYGLMAR